METAVDVESIVVVDDAVGDADARRASEVHVRIDRQAFVSIEKRGIVRWIDDDIGRSGNATTRRNVAGFQNVIRRRIVLADVGLQQPLPLQAKPPTRLPSVESGAAVGRDAAAPKRLLQPIPGIL